MMNLMNKVSLCCLCHILFLGSGGGSSERMGVLAFTTPGPSDRQSSSLTTTTRQTAKAIFVDDNKVNDGISKGNNNMIASTLLGLIIGFTATTTSSGVVANAIEQDAIIGTPLEKAIVQMSDASYPVLSSITDISSLTIKIYNLVDKKIPTSKAVAAFDKGIDTFLAIPDEKVDAFVSTLQTSVYNDNVCSSSIPIPTSVVSDFQSSSNIIQGLDSTKVKALQTKFAKANQVVPIKDGSSVCLPDTSKQFENLYISQTQLMLNVPRPEARQFVSSISTALSSVQSSEYLKLFPEVKKTFTTSTTIDKKTLMKFESSAKDLEKATQSDVRFVQRLK